MCEEPKKKVKVTSHVEPTYKHVFNPDVSELVIVGGWGQYAMDELDIVDEKEEKDVEPTESAEQMEPKVPQDPQAHTWSWTKETIICGALKSQGPSEKKSPTFAMPFQHINLKQNPCLLGDIG